MLAFIIFLKSFFFFSREILNYMQGTTINIKRQIKLIIIILLELKYIMKYNNFKKNII